MGTEEAPAQRETPDDDAHNESSSDSVHEATFSADDDDWKRKVLGALHARQLRLEDESKPPADAPCRTNRTGIIAQPMNLLRTPGKARNLKEFFEVWLHIVHGHQKLYNDCGIIHKDISPAVACFYLNKVDKVVGVLIDYDYHRGTQQELEVDGRLETSSTGSSSISEDSDDSEDSTSEEDTE